MKNALLWKLSKDGYHPSYIFGTMHVKSQQAFTRINDIEACLDQSQVFAAEYNLDQVQFVQQPSDLLIPDGKSLRDEVGDKKFLKMQGIIEKTYDVDISQYEYYLPLLLVNVIAEAILSKEHKLPLDMFLWKMAKEKGLQLEGVESYESQQIIMRKIKLKDQAKMVSEIARNPSKYRKSILQMANLYEEENILLLYKKGKRSLGRYRNILLKRRNKIMAARTEELSQTQSAFIAVGAGHLAGNYGVLRLLKEKGWKLEAL